MHFANFGAWFYFVGLAAEAWSFIQCDEDTANASTQSWLGRVSFLHNWIADGSITRFQGSGSCMLMLLWNNFEYAEIKIIPVLRNYTSVLGLVFFFFFKSSPLFGKILLSPIRFVKVLSFCIYLVISTYHYCYLKPHNSLAKRVKMSNIEKIKWLCNSFIYSLLFVQFVFLC